MPETTGQTRPLTLDEMKANRKLWVDALRSGKYLQARGTLMRRGVGYCCLGVACRVFGLSDDEISKYDNVTHLPQVKKWLGLPLDSEGNNGGYYKDGWYYSLADENDYNKTFEQIADIIESEPRGLFVNPESAS